MGSHFSSIGVAMQSEQEFLRLLMRAENEGALQPTPQGDYLYWALGEGAEMWIQKDGENIVGCNPHFAGRGAVKVGLIALRPSEEYPLDGSLHGWADPADAGNPASGQYPSLFDVPDFRRIEPRLSLPQTITVQIAAFAHELTLSPTIEAYEASQTKEPRWATESFIPSGLFGDAPRAIAIFTGVILEAEKRINPTTGDSYYWFLVRTLGGTFDVLADQELVTEPPQVDGILSGSFWLSGKVQLES